MWPWRSFVHSNPRMPTKESSVGRVGLLGDGVPLAERVGRLLLVGEHAVGDRGARGSPCWSRSAARRCPSARSSPMKSLPKLRGRRRTRPTGGCRARRRSRRCARGSAPRTRSAPPRGHRRPGLRRRRQAPPLPARATSAHAPSNPLPPPRRGCYRRPRGGRAGSGADAHPLAPLSLPSSSLRLSTFLSNFPTLVFGTSSMNANSSGIHHLATRSRRWSHSSSHVTEAPSSRTTQASGRSGQRLLGLGDDRGLRRAGPGRPGRPSSRGPGHP